MSSALQTRGALTERLIELEARYARLKADLAEAMSANLEEQAIEKEDDETLMAQETLVVERIAAIRAAIARVDERRYGICLSCGENIGQSRLGAIPEATQCISCATKDHG